MIPMILKDAQVLIPSTIQANTNNPDKPYQKVRVLAKGADDFLTVNCSNPVSVGIYNMVIVFREGIKNGKGWHFFDLQQLEPVKA